MSLRTPIELGIAAYMGGFYASLRADTQFMTEYIGRGLAKSIVWVPGRMVDDVEHMIAEWRKNENNPGPGLSSMLPVIFVALDKNFQPVLPEFGVAVPETDIAFPGDPEQRAYRASTTCNEYRSQIVFCSPDPATAHSLILQFNRWTTQGPMGRRFQTEYEFAGFKTKWPVVLETIDCGAVSTPVGDQKNLTILVADISLRATVPMFSAPGEGEPNDGKSAPAGYPVVVEANIFAAVTGRRSKTYIDAKGNIVVEES